MKKLKILLLLGVIFLSGCEAYNSNTNDNFYLNPAKNLNQLGRVAFIQMDNKSSFPKVSSDITEIISRELQKKTLFGLDVINQNDAVWHSLRIKPDTSYDLQQMAAIRRTLSSDTLLVGTVTNYNPYPHLTLGLRLKMIDLTDGQLIWAIEQIWDSADKNVQHRIKRYYNGNILRKSTLGEQLGTVSSLKFMKFVAYEIANTMDEK